MSDEINLGPGFSGVGRSDGCYQVNGRYPFYGEVKSENDSVEVIQQNNIPPPYHDVNLYLATTESVQSVLTFTQGEAGSGIFALNLVPGVTGVLVLRPDDPEAATSRLGTVSAEGGMSLLVTDGDGSVRFVSSPSGRSVFGVLKQELASGEFRAQWCWYGVAPCDDNCPEPAANLDV